MRMNKSLGCVLLACCICLLVISPHLTQGCDNKCRGSKFTLFTQTNQG